MSDGYRRSTDGRQLFGFFVGRKEVIRITGVDGLAHVGREFADLGVVGVACRPFRELPGEDHKAKEVSQDESFVLAQIPGPRELVEIAVELRQTADHPLRLHEEVLGGCQFCVEQHFEHLGKHQRRFLSLLFRIINVPFLIGGDQGAVRFGKGEAHGQERRPKFVNLQRTGFQVEGEPQRSSQRGRERQHRLQCLDFFFQAAADEPSDQEFAVKRIHATERGQVVDSLVERDVIAVFGLGQIAEGFEIGDHMVELILEFFQVLGRVEPFRQKLSRLD